MPLQHASIVYSQENDLHGLQYPGAPEREPHTLHHYIRSHDIESAIRNIIPFPEDGLETVSQVDGRQVRLVIEETRLDRREENKACRDRLTARIELSRKYEQKMKRTSREIVLTALEKRMDKLIEAHLEDRILSIPTAGGKVRNS